MNHFSHLNAENLYWCLKKTEKRPGMWHLKKRSSDKIVASILSSNKCPFFVSECASQNKFQVVVVEGTQFRSKSIFLNCCNSLKRPISEQASGQGPHQCPVKPKFFFLEILFVGNLRFAWRSIARKIRSPVCRLCTIGIKRNLFLSLSLPLSLSLSLSNLSFFLSPMIYKLNAANLCSRFITFNVTHTFLSLAMELSSSLSNDKLLCL